jgi:hypothetical protein
MVTIFVLGDAMSVRGSWLCSLSGVTGVMVVRVMASLTDFFHQCPLSGFHTQTCFTWEQW